MTRSRMRGWRTRWGVVIAGILGGLAPVAVPRAPSVATAMRRSGRQGVFAASRTTRAAPHAACTGARTTRAAPMRLASAQRRLGMQMHGL